MAAMNTAFLLIKPEASTDAFLTYITGYLHRYGIHIDEMVPVSSEELNARNLIPQHYEAVHYYANAPSEDLSKLIRNNEEVKSAFYQVYHELWDTVVEEGRLLSAKDAMVTLGNLTPMELSEMWWAHSRFQPPDSLGMATHQPLLLQRGLYVQPLGEERYYVLNGFYPLIVEKCLEDGARCCWMSLVWPESTLTWADFLNRVIGQVDPPHTTPGTLRHELFTNPEKLGLARPLSIGLNGLDVSSGPLEALAQRCLWADQSVHEDVYGRHLLQEGIPYSFLQRVLSNPVLIEAGAIRSIFGLLSNLQSSEAVRRLADVYLMLKQDTETHTNAFFVDDIRAGEEVVDLTAGCEEEVANIRNTAFLFVKPHACTEEVCSLVSEMLAQQIEGLSVDRVEDVEAKQIQSKNIIDRHYGVIARHALDVDPRDIVVSEEAQSLFKDVCGMSWADALLGGRVWNAAAALTMLGELSPLELYTLWEKETTKVKLTSGAYVCRHRSSHHGDAFIVNGFYPLLREMFLARKAKVRCFVVSWPEQKCSWTNFRALVVGSTNPATAPETSLRGTILRKWSELGLSAEPNTTYNAIHASASPLEALVERHLWLGIPIEHDVLAYQMLNFGVSSAVLLRWASNPLVCVEDVVPKNAFDVVENMDTSEMIGLAREVEQQSMSAYREAAVNSAVVLLQPRACTERAIALVLDVLKRARVSVKSHGDYYSRAAHDRVMETRTMTELRRYASLSGDALAEALPTSATEAFFSHFKSYPSDVSEVFLGAVDACAKLNLSPTELMKKFDDSNPIKLVRHVHVAYLREQHTYVVNGFFPYVEEGYNPAKCRVHYFEVEWKESKWSWEDFCGIIVGNEDVSKSTAGSLQRTISEEWRELGLPERPCFRSQSSVSVSSGPLEGLADRASWLQKRSVQLEQRVGEDPMTQRLLMEGVPLNIMAYYSLGYRECHALSTVEAEKSVLRQMSYHRSTSACCEAMRLVARQIHRTAKLNYAFLWLHPSTTKEVVREQIPALLKAHKVSIRNEGEVSMETASAKRLLDSPFTTLYRNSCERHASEIPITDAERATFFEHFEMQWETAIRLFLVVNATEAVARYGETRIISWWDACENKVCLSPNLYIGYMEVEGMYVVNGFYPYLASRLYAGPRAVWYSVCWDADLLSWEDFQSMVVGDADPSVAMVGSIRHHLCEHWSDYGLNGPPDSVENYIHASASPVEAMAERCLWLNLLPEEDVVGRLLVQNGVNVNFLHHLLQNPVSHFKGQPVSSATAIFDFLPQSTADLARALVVLQHSYAFALFADHSVIVNPSAMFYLREDGSDISEVKRKVQAAIVLKSAKRTAEAYPSTLEGKAPGHKKSCAASKPVDATAEPVAVIIGEDGLTQPSEAAAEPRYCHALLSISPSYTVKGRGASMIALLREFLASHQVEVVLAGAIPDHEATEMAIFVKHYARLVRYGMLETSAHTIGRDATLMQRFEDSFGEPMEPSRVLTAVEVAAEFNLTPKKTFDVWKTCFPIVRLAGDLFVGKVPTEDLYIINGFVPYCQEQFSAPSDGKHFLLVKWAETAFTYEEFTHNVLGDTYVEQARLGSFHATLVESWQRLGLAEAPHPFLGVVQASDNALVAMQQRQLWLRLGVSVDALGRRALGPEYEISPFVLRRALTNPIMETAGEEAESASSPSNARRVFDVVEGAGADEVLEVLHTMEEQYRTQQVRNTAFVLIKPHALCRRFARRVEHVFSKHNLRIDDEGDVAGNLVRSRGLVRYLYPAVAGYAVRDPASIILTKEEQAMVEEGLGTTWQELILGDCVVNAYKALSLLGDITPQQLYAQWKGSRRRVLVRPDLEIAYLEEHGLHVVNGYFPALKQSFEAPQALLHWYVVSWPEEQLTWSDFLENVVGAREPSNALPGSIRAQLYEHWREYGLLSIPDSLQNGVHASEGPLQAMSERINFIEYDMSEDPLGELLQRKEVHSGLLELWMKNPDVPSRGVTAGIFEHLARFDTSRLIRVMETLSAEVGDRQEARRAGIDVDALDAEEAELVDEAVLEQMAPAETSLLEKVEENPAGSEGGIDADDGEPLDPMALSWKSAPQADEDPILYRNAAVLFLQPYLSMCPAAHDLLLEVLKAHGVRIISECEQESSARLVDRLWFTEAFFALRTGLAGLLRDSPDISAAFKKRFAHAFGETWESATDAEKPRLFSASEVMEKHRLSAQQLHDKVSLSTTASVHVGVGISVSKLAAEDVFVVNGRYPYQRQRMQAVSLTPNEMCSARESRILGGLVVTFDERELSWKEFRENVVGDVDPSLAVEGSFRGRLLKQWKELGLSSAPNVVDCGVVESSGPLQAFAQRQVFFGQSDAIPDPLVRSLCLAEVDPLVLTTWRDNPLVSYEALHRGEEAEREATFPVVSRLFDLVTNVNTRDIIEIVRGAENFSVRSERKDLMLLVDHYKPQAPRMRHAARRKQRDYVQAAAVEREQAAAAAVAEAAQAEAEAEPTNVQEVAEATTDVDPNANNNVEADAEVEGAAAVEPESSAAAEASTPSKPSIVRKRLTDAVVADALLNANTPEEVEALWLYYREKGQRKTPPQPERIWARKEEKEEQPTINFRDFERDFNSLESFGAPLCSHELQRLFKSIVAKGCRMSYNEFARAVALYRAM